VEPLAEAGFVLDEEEAGTGKALDEWLGIADEAGA